MRCAHVMRVDMGMEEEETEKPRNNALFLKERARERSIRVVFLKRSTLFAALHLPSVRSRDRSAFVFSLFSFFFPYRR